MSLNVPSPAAVRSVTRVAFTHAAVILVAVVLSSCAMYSAPPVARPSIRELPDQTGTMAIAAWQVRLGQYIESTGGGDPAVLAQLPALRSAAVARPSQILFAATDIEALVPERDGLDVFGLLVGKHSTANGPRYMFIVGVVERRDYWPVAVGDVRVAAVAFKGGVASWETGPADVGALMRYRAGADPSTTVRFPAVQDRFRIVDCDPGVCVEERGTGARWALYPGAPATLAPPAQLSVPAAQPAR
jgi:hypothetical protein